MKNVCLFVLSLWLGLSLAPAQEYEGKTLVKASLVADTSAVIPGQPFQVGLLLKMVPGWHTYWEYPGDAGLPTSLTWKLPEGFESGAIKWPLPHRIFEPGDIEVYAYKDEVLLLTTIVPPENLSGDSVSLQAVADWLVCEEICIPGSADLTLELPVADRGETANAELFAQYRSQLPSEDPPPYALEWTRDGKGLVLQVGELMDVKAVDLFPLPAKGQQVGHPRTTGPSDASAVIEIPGADDLRGVLMVENESGRKGWFVSSVQAPNEPKAAATDRAEFEGSGSQSEINPKSTIRNPQSATSLWLALIYGMIGGMILNLMPCVLPVISLKIFGFIRQAGEDPGKIFRHGLAFVAGIFLWFMGLGILIVALKMAGSEVTWAFQFQNPWFNLVIASIVFVFALNLFGVFEIVLPGRASNALDGAASGDGYAGSFSQGVFATLLATPCTAPFLGTALGFAFSQSAVVILAMFASVAFGMALPYLILSARPGWMKILPKPGPWMERMKQFMGFPLLATLLWLLYILGNQKGLEGVIWAGSFLLCLGLAAWIYGAFCGPLPSGRTRVVSLFLILLVVVGGGWYFLAGKFSASQRTESSASQEGGIPWQPFTQKGLDALLAEGKPVFVDFTADWCITCKVNERSSIAVPAVRAFLAEKGIVPIKADWTNANPEITAALKKFGRVGVPFYVIYPAGRPEEPITLPEILTESIVLEGLRKAIE